MAPNNGNSVGALKTGFTIIEALNDTDKAGVTELANQLGLPKSTVFSHLQTLKELEYVRKEGDKYQLCCRFLELGERTRGRTEIYSHAKKEVDRLAEETGEISGLMIEEHGLGVLIYRAEGERAVQLDTFIGIRFNLHTAALGKAILANLPDERIEEILDQRGLPQRRSDTITDRETLYDELEEIREQNVAFSDEERTPGFRSIAAPITNDVGEVFGSISIAGPTSRLQGEKLETEYPELLQDAANVIELDINYG